MIKNNIKVSVVAAGMPNSPQEIFLNYGNYYKPTVSDSGVISWEFIPGEVGDFADITPIQLKSPGIRVLGLVTAIGNLPTDAEIGDCYGVGAAAPFTYYIYNGTTWDNNGQLVIGYFTPSVDASGNLSWSNNIGLANPTTQNIVGPPIGLSIGEVEYGVSAAATLTGTAPNYDLNLVLPRGLAGDTGNGIVSVVRTSGNGAAGTTDTYTITYTDATTSTFSVYNGANGIGTGDMLKATYDPNNKNGNVFNVDNHVSGSTNKVFLATDKTKLDGLGQADWTATEGTSLILHKPDLGALAALDLVVTDKLTDKSVTNAKLADMSAKTVKGNFGASATTPSDVTILDVVEYGLSEGAIDTVVVDAEYIPVSVSATSTKKITWANFKAALKTYFDTLYCKFKLITFVAGDWTLVGDTYTYTVLAATHTMGANFLFDIHSLEDGVYVKMYGHFPASNWSAEIDGTGNLTLSSTVAYAGKIIMVRL